MLCFLCSSSQQCLLFSPSQLSTLFPYLLYALCHSPAYLSITAVCLFLSQVYHSLLSAAAGPSRFPAPHIRPTDYTVDYMLLSVQEQTRSVGSHNTFLFLFFSTRMSNASTQISSTSLKHMGAILVQQTMYA